MEHGNDPARFVRGLPLFSSVDHHLVDPVLETLTVVYEPAGTQLLTEGGEPAEHLWIVRKGHVELRRGDDPVLELEEGDWFGMPSLIDRAPPTTDAVVTQDALLYRIEASAMRTLVDLPSVAAHVRGGLAERLRAMASATSGQLGSLPVTALVRGAPLVVDATTTAQEAAALMRERAATSVIVDGPDRGIVTDRDLRNRLVADGRPPDTPVGEVASRPLVCVAADATAGDTLDILIGSARHHAVVTVDGSPHAPLVGVVTTGDLLRHDAESGVHVVRMVERAEDQRALRAAVGRRDRLAVNLFHGGASAGSVARAITGITDAATRAAIRLALEEVGDPGVAFTWLALGSQARREQGLLTDQDHALVHAPADDAASERLGSLAERVVHHLEAAGYPRCAGGTMATRWAGDLETWSRRFTTWLREPDQQALYRTAIFLDHRPILGEVAVDALGDVMRDAGRDRVLVARLASAAWTARPPVGWFHRLRADRSGYVDLKAGGLVPIVDLARVLAVEAGVSVPGTIARLDAAEAGGGLSTEGAATLREAFRFLQDLRLRTHLDAEPGAAPSNLLDPATLGVLERRHLKEVLVAVADLQRQLLTERGAADVAR